MAKEQNNDKEVLVSFLLRSGLAIVFLYAAISSFLAPGNWIAYFPKFIRNFIDGNILLFIFSVYEVILGVWLLSNKKVFYVSILSILTILIIIIPNIFLLDVIFRDIAILFMAIALAVLSYRKEND